MSTTEQVQRFMNELALFKTTVKYGNTLTENQVQVIKFKLYELIFEMEATVRPSARADHTPII